MRVTQGSHSKIWINRRNARKIMEVGNQLKKNLAIFAYPFFADFA